MSEDEKSNEEGKKNFKNFLKENNLNIGKKIKGIYDYLEIRKNYPKPIIINFTLNNNDNKYKTLQKAVTARIFKNLNTDNNNNIDLSNEEDFPIKILSEKQYENKQTGLIDNIKDNLEDIIKEIHGSYLTKDQIIKNLNEKFSTLSKSSLANFIKNKTMKSKNRVKINLNLENMVC